MRRTFLPTLILALVALQPGTTFCQEITVIGPDRRSMHEGETYAITWAADSIQSVSIVAHGARTPVGGKPRGNFVAVIAEAVPAAQEWVHWTVPWLDSVEFLLKAKGYNSLGYQVAMDERRYGFRPAVMVNRTEDGIYLDLHGRANQRVYVQKDRRLTRAYLSSSSENYVWLAPSRHSTRPHDHAGVFKVLEKKRSHWSTLFNVRMPWAMRYHGGHYIHATSPNLYRLLGRPASHGCNRLTHRDARELYQTTPLGARVEVIGPEG